MRPVLGHAESHAMSEPRTPQPFTIDVVSDVVCPWCYIGKRRLEAALAACAQRRSATSTSP